MFAQYSPLFTSGLLSESNTPSSSRRPSLELHQKVPRGSLPVDVNIDSLYETSSCDEEAVLLTFMPRRRRAEAGNSFLSLDLAENQSLRSMSLRRKDTVTTRATTHFGRSVPASPTSPPMPFASFSRFPTAPLPRKSLVRHSSREGLPGAKPAPSSDLPDLPSRRPRPADLTITFSTCLSEYSPSPSTSCHRSVHSEPSITSPISPLLSEVERSYFMFSPPTSPPANVSYPWGDDVPRSAPTTSPLRARPSLRSTASHRTRQVNRSAALAALEGRSGSKQRPRPRPNNFMSMSDDEDDGDDESSLVTPVAVSAPSPSVAPLEPTLLDILQEEEDVVVPSAHPMGQKRLSSAPSSSGSRKTRSRRGTLESLLTPLTNFIDFRDDEGSTRSWRSFVEIS